MRTLLILLTIFFAAITEITGSRILNSTTLYFVTPNYLYFEDCENKCQNIPCENVPNSDSLCKRCEVNTYDNIRIGTNSSNKFVLVYTTISTKPFQVSNPADMYNYCFGYNMYIVRIFKFHEDYVLTADKTNFVDSSPDHAGNFIQFTFIMGYDFS